MKITGKQRILLWCFAAIGLFGINGLFLYAAFFGPEEANEAYSNLYALAFILEAFVLLPLLCFLIYAARLRAPGWITFLILSLAGSLAFSIPLSPKSNREPAFVGNRYSILNYLSQATQASFL